MSNTSEHLKQHYSHWKMTVIGSAIGFAALIIDLFYMYITNNLSSFARGEIIEISLIIIPLFIFLWFFRTGVYEYEEIKEELKPAEATSKNK